MGSFSVEFDDDDDGSEPAADEKLAALLTLVASGMEDPTAEGGGTGG